MGKRLNQVSIRLVKEKPLLSEEFLTSPEKVAMLVGDYIRDMDREVLCAVNFNSKLQPINFNVVSMGTVNNTVAVPREILKSAILSNAAHVIILHNHPSGILDPSKDDVRVTERLIGCCEMLGVPLLDHIIVGPDKDKYFSMKQKETIRFESFVKYNAELQYLNFKSGQDIKIAEDVKVVKSR